MKLQVVLKMHAKNQAARSIQLAVAPTDTILSVKERVSEIEPNPFPEAKLSKDNKVLGDGNDGQTLVDCGVKEGDSLVFVVEASEAVFVQQLSKLLQPKALAATELSLLYCHRHGVTVAQALQILGSDEPFLDFLQRQKKLNLEKGGMVSLCSGGETTAEAPQPGAVEQVVASSNETEGAAAVEVTVSIWSDTGNKTMELDCEASLFLESAGTVAEAKKAIIEAEMVPFTDVDLMLNDVVLDDEQTLASCGIQDGCELDLVVHASEEAFVQQLSELLEAGPRSSNELSLLFSYRNGFGTARVMTVLGRGEKFAQFLGRHPSFTLVKGCVSLSRSELATIPDDSPSASEVVRDRAVEAISAAGFLNIQSVTKCQACPDCTGFSGPEAVFSLAGLPPNADGGWHQGLLHSVAGILQEQAGKTKDVQSIAVVGSAVQLSMLDATVQLRFDAAN